MNAFQKPSKRTVVISSAAGIAVLGAVALGGAAFADGPSAMPAPSGSSSSAPAPAAPAAGNSGSEGSAPAAPTQGSAPAAPREHEPHIGGEVLTVSGSTVTVKDHDGFTRTIALGSDVAVTKDGAKSDASAIVKGAHIEATGTVDSNGTTLDATEVSVGQPTPPAGGPGRGGPGHGGPGAPQGQQGQGRSGGQGSQGQAPTPPSGAPTAPNGTAPSAPSAPAAPSTQPSAPTQGS